MIENKLNILIEQTSFLLEKQQGLLGQINDTFKSLISIIDEKLNSIDKEDGEQKFQDLRDINSNILGHKKRIIDEISDDIKFLKEQLSAVEKIKSIEDNDKAEELLNMIVDKDEKLQEMGKFKEEVERSFAEWFLLLCANG